MSVLVLYDFEPREGKKKRAKILGDAVNWGD
jgi:hypothetical protein